MSKVFRAYLREVHGIPDGVPCDRIIDTPLTLQDLLRASIKLAQKSKGGPRD